MKTVGKAIIILLVAALLASVLIVALDPHSPMPDRFRFGLYPLENGNAVLTDRTLTQGVLHENGEVILYYLQGVGTIMLTLSEQILFVYIAVAAIACIVLVLCINKPKPNKKRETANFLKALSEHGKRHEQAEENKDF